MIRWNVFLPGFILQLTIQLCTLAMLGLLSTGVPPTHVWFAVPFVLYIAAMLAVYESRRYVNGHLLGLVTLSLQFFTTLCVTFYAVMPSGVADNVTGASLVTLMIAVGMIWRIIEAFSYEPEPPSDESTEKRKHLPKPQPVEEIKHVLVTDEPVAAIPVRAD